MRKAFASAIVERCTDSNSVFLTGDLGFMALEDIQIALGNRFINCGVSEQNMIGVAAGLAKSGYEVYAYSIAPFIYARPFEQIRNDIQMSKAVVCLVGNGGGYGYGEMGPTHHALEDIATMNAIGVNALVPAFDEDLFGIISKGIEKASYLRLGYDEKPKGFQVPEFQAFRKLLDGNSGVWLVLGPLAGVALQLLLNVPENNRPSLYVVSILPIVDIPTSFLNEVKDSNLVVFEEHVLHGGLGMQLLYDLQKRQIYPSNFIHKYALSYPSGRYGSQKFHRRESGLSIEAMQEIYKDFYEKH